MNEVTQTKKKNATCSLLFVDPCSKSWCESITWNNGGNWEIKRRCGVGRCSSEEDNRIHIILLHAVITHFVKGK